MVEWFSEFNEGKGAIVDALSSYITIGSSCIICSCIVLMTRVLLSNH